jgi:predicted metal-dependent hydrolase
MDTFAVGDQRQGNCVVVHELCHLRHDHSPAFWKCVERVFPDYQACKEWLRVNGKSLDV